MNMATRGFEQHTVFSRDEIATIRNAIGAHMDGVARALCKPFEQSHPELGIDCRLDTIAARDQSYAELLWTAACTDAHRRPEIVAALSNPGLHAHLERFVGGELGPLTVRLRANVPSFPERRHRWHSDVAINDGSVCSRVRVTAWIPLDDVDADNGSLQIAHGLRDAPLEHTRDGNRLAISDDHVDGTRTIVECGLGDVVFLDRFTPHRAVPNRSNAARWALVVWAKRGAHA